MVKPKKLELFVCPICEEIFDNEFDAEDCCPREIDVIEGYQCSECSQNYDNKEEAKECCKDV